MKAQLLWVALLGTLLACTSAVPASRPADGGAATAPISSVRPPSPSSGPGPTASVDYEGRQYYPAAGPIREELLSVAWLENTGLVLNDRSIQEGNDGHEVFVIPGLPVEKGFLVRFPDNDESPHIPETAYPSCQLGSGAFLYTEVNSAPPLSPLGSGTPSPNTTPVPTPVLPAIQSELSPDGLLSAGWPHIDLEHADLSYEGAAYTFTSFRYINENVSDTSIPPDTLEEIEVLELTYSIAPNLPPPLDQVFTENTVVDYMRLLRLKSRPSSDVIVLDTCPEGFQEEQFFFMRSLTDWKLIRVEKVK